MPGRSSCRPESSTTKIWSHAASLAESPTPGFTVWDLRGSWQAFDDLLLVAGVENFTDNNYQEHLDFRSQNGIRVFQPGVNFYLGADLTY